VDKLIRFSWIFGVIGLLLVVGGGTFWYVTSDTGNTFRGLMGAAAVAFVLYAFLDRDTLVANASSRQVQLSAGAGVLVIIATVLAAALYTLTRQHDHTFDWTSDKRYTLSEHSATVLAGLDQDVTITGLFRTGSPPAVAFDALTGRMKEKSGHLVIEDIDPLEDPVAAKKYALDTDNGTVVLTMGDKKQRLESSFEEKDVIDAIVRLQSAEDHTICWSEGHGEADPDDDQSRSGLGSVVLKLENQNYTTKPVKILSEGIPADCDALVIAGPGSDFLPHEREALAAYLASGGRALVLLEPDILYETPLAPELSADLERYGVRAGRDLVVETDPEFLLSEKDPSSFIVYPDGFGAHPILQRLNAFVMFRTVRSVSKIEGTAGVRVTELLHGSATAWAETNLESPDGLKPDPGADLVGSVPLAAAVEIDDPSALHVAAHVDPSTTPAATSTDPGLTFAVPEQGAVAVPEAGTGVPADFTPKKGGRLVVIGDADFPSNVGIALGNDKDLFLNAIAWLVDEEDQLGERPDDEPDRIEPPEAAQLLLGLISVLFVPGGALVAAAIVLIRRWYL
jgi:ABC-type uncharacterized transport system involved in gliding motility auxiliary subunit